MQRVSVVGNSGSGKSTLSRRIAGESSAPYVELDAVRQQPGWTPRPPYEFLAEADAIAALDQSSRQ